MFHLKPDASKPVFSRQDAKAQRKPRADFRALARETDFDLVHSAKPTKSGFDLLVARILVLSRPV